MKIDEQRFWSKVQRGKYDECWTWKTGKDAKGYGLFSVGGRAGRNQLAHRVSYYIAFGVLPEGKYILHSCDNPPCVNPHHLRPGNQSDNMKDMAARERTNTTKLSASEVIEIRRMYNEGYSQRQLAKRFNVAQSNIFAIVNRRSWTHL